MGAQNLFDFDLQQTGFIVCRKANANALSAAAGYAPV
jgi:hypothetical protein